MSDNKPGKHTVIHSSKGNQLKWKSENLWFKFDFLGYEGAAEFLASEILRHSNIENFVRYQLVEQQYHGRRLKGCVSENFLHGGTVITAHRLFLLNYGELVDKVIGGKPSSDRIEDFVDRMRAMTGIPNFGAYLTATLELDAFTLNDDRHFNNIAVVKNDDGSFALCPIFDNGAAFLSDTYEFPLCENPIDHILRVHAKPFLTDFDEQVNICHRLYGNQLQLTGFDASVCLEEIGKIYGAEISDRMQSILEYQFQRYSDLFRDVASPEHSKE